MYTIQTVTHPVADTRHPLLLLQSAHGDRYFFGKIAEGSQRALTENKTKLSKLENIFLTGQMDWSSVGGLPGLILTAADQGKDKLRLHYGTNLVNYAIATWRYFVFRFGIHLETNIMDESNTIYKDKMITVKSILSTPKTRDGTLRPPFTADENESLGWIVSNMFPKHPPTSKYDPSSDPYLNVELPIPKSVVSQVSTSYEVIINPVRGRFRLEEALRLGVPKGKLFAKLAQGETITLEDGSIVTSEQVLEETRQFAKILIIDIPDDEYLPGMVDKFKKYDLQDLGAVYYLLGDQVTINTEFINFMGLFGSNTQHIVSHSNVSSNKIIFRGSALTTMKLKALQTSSYNLPRTDHILSREFFECFNKPIPNGTTMIQKQENIPESSIPSENVHILQQGADILLEPYTKGEEALKAKYQSSNIPDFSWHKAFHSSNIPLRNVVPFKDLIEKEIHTNHFNTTPQREHKIELVTLGTGSALPSKYRNVISTLIKVPYMKGQGKIEKRMILFDAGENTLGTMRRMFSSIDLASILGDLKMIYLSHLHADHHLGIVSLLQEWYKHTQNDNQKALYIVSPWQYHKFIKEWLSFESPGILPRLKFISCEHLIEGSYVRMETKPFKLEAVRTIKKDASETKKRKLELDQSSSYRDVASIRQMYRDLGILNFQTVAAHHCHWAYSNSITFYMEASSRKTFKISYSGDTRPNIDKFARTIGYRSDLLIHEATLDNELVEDAVKKRHCTINEAIEVANKMETKKLVLTHFSQRYPKLPQLDNNLKVLADEYCFAFDGMIVDYDNIGIQESTFDLLNKAFAEEKEQDEQQKD